MVVADSGNGASNVLDWGRYLFINTELTVHFLREPVGEWVLLDARDADRRGRRGAGDVGAQRPVGTGRSRRAGAARRATMIAAVAARDERDRAAARALARADGRELVDRCGDRAQHGLHLEQREARAEAAAHAAAERDPRVGAGGLLEEALGPERERVRVDVLARVHQQDVRLRPRRPREVVAGDLERRLQQPQDGGDDRPQPQRLLDDGVQVVLVLRAQPLPRVAGGGRGARAPTRARSRSSRGRRRAASAARRAASRRPCRSCASSIERMSSRSARSGAARRRAISSRRAARRPARACARNARSLSAGPATTTNISRAGSAIQSSSVAEPRAQALVAGAEDRAHDDLERQRLHARAHRDRLAHGPATRPRARRSRGSARRRPASARRGTAAAASCARHVLGAVEQQHAARAEQRLEDRVALARVQHVRVAGEDLLDVVGMRDDDPRRAAVDVQRERVAEARAQPARVRAGPRDPAGGVEDVRAAAARAGGSCSPQRLVALHHAPACAARRRPGASR